MREGTAGNKLGKNMQTCKNVVKRWRTVTSSKGTVGPDSAGDRNLSAEQAEKHAWRRHSMNADITLCVTAA